jgi:hypothetical protein
MRIISNFKDYYDVVGAYDRDSEPVYVRHSSEIEDQTPNAWGLFHPGQTITPLSLPKSYALNGVDEQADLYYRQERGAGRVFFCGRVYPFYILSGLVNSEPKTFYCYNLNQYIAAIEQLNPTNKKKILTAIEDGVVELKAYRGRNIQSKEYLSRASWEKWTSSFNTQVADKYSQALKCPAAIRLPTDIRNKFQVILNPRLNQYNFQSQVDPFTAYQELSMYLGNTLLDTSNMEPRPITDKDRAETKGFNEWSFRRHKTEDRKYKKAHGE